MFYTAALCGSFNDQRLLGKAEQSALEPAQPLPLSQALVTAWAERRNLEEGTLGHTYAEEETLLGAVGDGFTPTPEPVWPTRWWKARKCWYCFTPSFLSVFAGLVLSRGVGGRCPSWPWRFPLALVLAGESQAYPIGRLPGWDGVSLCPAPAFPRDALLCLQPWGEHGCCQLSCAPVGCPQPRAGLAVGTGLDVLSTPASSAPFAQCRGTVFQHSLIHELAAVRGQRTSRTGAVGPVWTCAHSLFLLLHQGKHELRSPSSSVSLSAMMSLLLLPHILSQSPDALPTYCQGLSLSQTSPIFSYQPRSRIPDFRLLGTSHLGGGVLAPWRGLLVLGLWHHLGIFCCLELSFLGLYFSACLYLLMGFALLGF